MECKDKVSLYKYKQITPQFIDEIGATGPFVAENQAAPFPFRPDSRI
jgi:hypothetical protein